MQRRVRAIARLICRSLLNLPLRKLGPWFVVWNFFLLRLFFISVNLPCGFSRNVAMSRLMFPVAIWIYWISCRNGKQGCCSYFNCAPLDLGRSSKSCQSKFFSVGITLVDVTLNTLNWFQFQMVGPPFIPKGCNMFLLPSVHVKRMCMSTISFLVQKNSSILIGDKRF